MEINEGMIGILKQVCVIRTFLGSPALPAVGCRQAEVAGSELALLWPH